MEINEEIKNNFCLISITAEFQPRQCGKGRLLGLQGLCSFSAQYKEGSQKKGNFIKFEFAEFYGVCNRTKTKCVQTTLEKTNWF